MNKKYKGFTLVEMLIVMGILSVLMGIGVSVARFAVQRANNIQHQSAVDQLYQAFQSYYTDHREYPDETGSLGVGFNSFEEALDEGGGGVLDPYVDASFDGGSPAQFYYFVDEVNANQSFIVCVAFSPNDDEAQLGGYCNGNGFGLLPSDADPINQKVLPGDHSDPASFFLKVVEAANNNEGVVQEWNSAEGGWQ